MTISLTINGTEVKAQPGATVLEVAQANGIDIPTLCYSEKLKPVGACRLCVVEIENMRGYPSACTVPAMQGMVIHTETEPLKTLRRETLSLILAEHPYTCLVCKAYCGIFHNGTIRKAAVTTGCEYCPANGQCELQDLVKRLELTDMPYPISYRGLPVEHEDPFFDRDYNLCILCGRCVRVCQEVRHAGVLAFVNRGSQTIVGTAFGCSHLDTNCQFCGACVDMCPTGALADKRSKWEGVPDGVVSSVCPYCAVGCAVKVQVKNGKVIRAVGHPDGPANDGQLCVRGRFGVVDIVHNLTRLHAPLLHRHGRLIETAWSEALTVAAEKLAKYSGDEIAVIGSATATNEECYALQKFARTVLHTPNIAAVAGLPNSELAAEMRHLTAGPAIRSVRNADCVLTIGTNLFESHPILGIEVKHALSRGAGLIAVDARQTAVVDQSTVWLQPKIGTDHVLLAGLIQLLQQRLAASDQNPDLGQITAATGVSLSRLEQAADQLAHSERVIIIYGSGVTHHPTARRVIDAIYLLAKIAGQAGVILVPGEGNIVGAHDMGLHPALLPGYQPVPHSPGRNYEAIVEGIRQGQIKALYLAGELPPLAELEKLELLVVQDIVATENMQHADIVLPATTFAEMDGTFTNLEGRVQPVRQAIPAVGLSRPGWLIARDLAHAMGADGWTYQSAAEVMAEIAATIPAYAEVLTDAPGFAGTLRRFDPTGAARPASVGLDDVPTLTNDDYPLTLITERNLHHYYGACLTDHVNGMNLIKSEEILHLSSIDAQRLQVNDGDLITVTSPYGRAEIIVHIADGQMPPGVAFASFNRANNSPLFPGATPQTKAYAVRLEREKVPAA